ncbi:actin interacting protein 3 domain-containing protein [Ditylenchus destructor]|nr:actin interacting protein 3 domain-containing protein [Ditylenchus destructor]
MNCTSLDDKPSTSDQVKNNPLECQCCHSELSNPVRPSCQHYFCRSCLKDNKCPICGRAIDVECISDDRVLSYVIESSREATETCANCDKIIHPMYFCDTCQQPLCVLCRAITHQAKIFSGHQISLLEESWKRGRLRTGVTCELHNEPFLLYCQDSKKLACIECFNSSSSAEKFRNFLTIDIAHKTCCDKLEKAALKMRIFQDELLEQIDLRKYLIEELHSKFDTEVAGMEQICDNIVKEIINLKDRLTSNVREQKSDKEAHLHEQLQMLELLQDPLKVNLLSASIFCSYAPKIDLLQYYSDLNKSIQQILSNKVEKLQCTTEMSVDFKSELWKMLKDEFGITGDGVAESASTICQGNSPNPMGTAYGNENSLQTPLVAYSPLINGQDNISAYIEDNSTSNGHFINKQSMPFLNMELNSAFAEYVQKIDSPMKQFVGDIAKISKVLLNIQRDITLRRCVVNKEEFVDTLETCENLKKGLEEHSAFVQSVQPLLRDVWQEQIERIHRQQRILREKMDDIAYLQKFAEKAFSSALQLKPFALYMASVISSLDGRRSQLVNFSPMEQICLQITSLEPDSEKRVKSIEKEEESRRLTKEQHKLSTKPEAQQVKDSLKETKISSKPRNISVLVDNDRDRSSLSNLTLSSSMSKAAGRRKQRRMESVKRIGIKENIPEENMSHNEETAQLKLEEVNETKSNEKMSKPPPPLSPSNIEPINPINVRENAPNPAINVQNQTQNGLSSNENVPNSKENAQIEKPSQLTKLIPRQATATDAPSEETVRARDRLLEAIRERVKRIEPYDEATNT